MAKRPYGKRGEKKSEMLEFRLSWSDKEALREMCERDNVAVSARLRDLIKAHIDQQYQAEPLPQPEERTFIMPRFFKTRPRALLASTLTAAASLTLAAAAPSAAGVDARAAFERLDGDGNGEVSFTEFRSHIEAEGFFMTPDAPVDARERVASESEIMGALHSEFARYDRNRDDVLDAGEFATRYIWRMETSFNAIDRNDDGFIEARELARVMGGIGLNETHLRRSRLERAEAAIETIDGDNDGRLDFSEYSDVS